MNRLSSCVIPYLYKGVANNRLAQHQPFHIESDNDTGSDISTYDQAKSPQKRA